MSSYLRELKQRSETEFLEFRQRIKESIRKKSIHNNGNDIAPTLESKPRKRKLPYNEFGSFFGPSQPGIASRVLQERKSLLKDELLAAKVLDSIQTNKSSGPTSGSDANELKRKAKKLKESRDYSFLFSDDAELPVSIMEPPSSLVPNSTPSCIGSHSRPDSSGSRIVRSTKGQAQTKPGGSAINSQTHKPSSKLHPQRPAPTRKSVPVNHHRKELTQKLHSSSKPLTSDPNQQRVKQRKVTKSSSQMVPRQQALPPLISKPTPLKKKKKKNVSEEDEEALRLIREMCKTDRFAGRDLDDRGMEASLEDIIKEEKRSEKLAKQEDAEQLRLIQEEERRERVLRKEKKQKLSH